MPNYKSSEVHIISSIFEFISFLLTKYSLTLLFSSLSIVWVHSLIAICNLSLIIGWLSLIIILLIILLSRCCSLSTIHLLINLRWPLLLTSCLRHSLLSNSKSILISNRLLITLFHSYLLFHSKVSILMTHIHFSLPMTLLWWLLVLRNSWLLLSKT